jgi:hypothetical protein
MNAQAMTLNELFHFQDTDISRRWYETTNMTPEEAIDKATEYNKMVDEKDLEYGELREEYRLLHEKMTRMQTSLESRRFSAFAFEPTRDGGDFDDTYDRYEEGSVTVTEYAEQYCPDMNVTAMFILIEDGELVEVWATEWANHWSLKTTFTRVF